DARDVRLVRLVTDEALVVVPASLDNDEDVALRVDGARDADIAEAGLLAEEAAVFVEFGEEAAGLRSALQERGLDLHEDGLDVLHAGFPFVIAITSGDSGSRTEAGARSTVSEVRGSGVRDLPSTGSSLPDERLDGFGRERLVRSAV